VRGLNVASSAIGSLKGHRLWDEVLDWPNDPHILDAKVQPALLEHLAETVLEQPDNCQQATPGHTMLEPKAACNVAWHFVLGRPDHVFWSLQVIAGVAQELADESEQRI